ncbi:MAG: ABC transporter ATP-binding protein [bacterium]
MKQNKHNLTEVLQPYIFSVVVLVVLTIIANGLSLAVPKIIASSIDSYTLGTFVLNTTLIKFSVIALLILVFTYLQNISQVYVSEKVARNLRNKLSEKISTQTYAYIEKITPEKLLTNLTADIDAIKSFVSQAIVSIISSIFLIIGASVLLLLTNWKLAIPVLCIIPGIGITFYFVLKKVRTLFRKTQEAIDWLNKVINESILGAALIRILNSRDIEKKKFVAANTQARDISLKILSLFAGLIPAINFFMNLATIVIVVLGGKYVIDGSMTLGSFTAFNSYLAILIFPIMIIGFMSNVIAAASASYGRIVKVLYAPSEKKHGKEQILLTGTINVADINLSYGQKDVLKHVSFSVLPGTKTAIIGPTGSGKTQLLYVITGLLDLTSGSVMFDGINVHDFDKENFHSQIGFVFQDSSIFNVSLRENIAFGDTVTDEYLKRAISSAELDDFVESLPKKLDTIVSERGSSLSGGQKQRIMLARALALNPKILLLDDFTARVDTKTERAILKNVENNYPDITLISVTQKIASIEHYDQIILLDEGEIIATGTHAELLENSPEYVQIYESQKSTENYEG